MKFRFLDLFVSECRRAKEKFQSLERDPEEVLSLYEKVFRWEEIEPTEVSGKVFAIDSSDGVIEHRNGGVIHISRGIGVSNDGEEIKDLSLEVFYPESGRALREYRSLSRENIEHSVAIKCLEECNDNSFLLIDGSLYGRMLHVPEELPIRGEFPLIIEYIERYYELISKALKSGVTLVGVSKDSRSRILRRHLIRISLEMAMERLGIEREERENIMEVFHSTVRRPKEAVQKILSMERSGAPREVITLLREALSGGTDLLLVSQLGKGRGFTYPILTRPHSPFIDTLSKYLGEEELFPFYLIDNFPRSFYELGEDFLDRARRSLELILKYPPVLITYCTLGIGDSPIRLDLISKELPRAPRETEFSKEIPRVLMEVLSLLDSMYSGERHYNVLLERADSLVKMGIKELRVYKKILEREINSIVRQSRGSRRVIFP